MHAIGMEMWVLAADFVLLDGIDVNLLMNTNTRCLDWLRTGEAVGWTARGSRVHAGAVTCSGGL
jgi:hypothetical protein